MRLMAGYSTSGVCCVQSCEELTRMRGLGAKVAPISTLLVSMRRRGAFSQTQPPCM